MPGAGVTAALTGGRAEAGTLLGAETDGATPATVSLEQPAVPMAIVANNATTIAITDQRVRRGPFLAERGRNRLPCSGVQATTPTSRDDRHTTDPSEHEHTGQQT